MILVPIDISGREFTERIISHIEPKVRIGDTEVHFLSMIPPLPYYASPEMIYTAELPGTDELCEGTETQLKGTTKQFSILKDRIHFHVVEGSSKDKISALARSLPANLVIIASHRSDITTCLLDSSATAVVHYTERSALAVH